MPSPQKNGRERRRLPEPQLRPTARWAGRWRKRSRRTVYRYGSTVGNPRRDVAARRAPQEHPASRVVVLLWAKAAAASRWVAAGDPDGVSREAVHRPVRSRRDAASLLPRNAIFRTCRSAAGPTGPGGAIPRFPRAQRGAAVRDSPGVSCARDRSAAEGQRRVTERCYERRRERAEVPKEIDGAQRRAEKTGPTTPRS